MRERQFFGRVLFFIVLFHSVYSQIQLNLHLTQWAIEQNDSQHHCLNIAAPVEDGSDTRQIIAYCMEEWPSTFALNENNFSTKFTFSQLLQQGITSEQLYLWSAPIDLIEEYQLYIDELPSHTSETTSHIFYNCTLPSFGPKCEYILESYNGVYSSLNEMVSDYYSSYIYRPTSFTCYTHLQCHRGPSPSCLDWTEICNEKVDCLDGGKDEEHCWQLEIHQCNDNEYQCSNGLCIPQTFYRDGPNIPDCLDQSDETFDGVSHFRPALYLTREPVFAYDDVSCVRTNNFVNLGRWSLTSSCFRNREFLLFQAMFSIKPTSINEQCWTAVKCIIHLSDSSKQACADLCRKGACNEIVNNNCSEIVYIPAYPVLHGHVFAAYNKTKLKYPSKVNLLEPTYVCYDDQRVEVPDDGRTLQLSKNNTCRLYADAKFSEGSPIGIIWLQLFIHPIDRWLHRSTPLMYNNSIICNQSIMYQCMNSSKCIPKIRVFDAVVDCYYGDDEDRSMLNNIAFMSQLPNSFKCKTTNQYFPHRVVNNGNCDCTIPGDSYCADEDDDDFYFQKTILFQTICDQRTHLFEEFTMYMNNTDESNCEQWPLIHVYNRCDGFWHFPNGTDEINCSSSFPLLNCSDNTHICVSSHTKELICLPIEKANDGIVDCIGAADEPTLCPRTTLKGSYPRIFHCKNIHGMRCILGDFLCDGQADCVNGEDEQVCQSNDLVQSTIYNGICKRNYELDGSNAVKVLCRLFVNNGLRTKVYFTLDQNENAIGHYSEPHEVWIPIRADVSIRKELVFKQPRCHRGLDVQVSLDKQKNLTKNVCLCSPSYYGDICQYQNQRISLTLQLRATSDSIGIPFIIIVSLIDNSNERSIHSYEQFNYQSTEQCQKKFHLYLLYSTRPKPSAREYSIHIDIYEKIKLTYRGSMIKSVNYSFLPVHRLAFLFDIPLSRDKFSSCSDKKCLHGKCIPYLNDPNHRTFCQCEKGWSGHLCTIKYTSLCSSQSLYLGKLANNRSLCVCPLNKIGPRCLIDTHVCQRDDNKACLNGGRCIPTDDYGISKNKYMCICLTGFFGDRCEIIRTKLIITFDSTLDLPRSIFVHFIEVKTNQFPVRTTTTKKILTGQNSVSIYWSVPFHLVFIELENQNYYLYFMRKTFIQSSIIARTLTSSSRCLHINEIFNDTLRNYSLLRRIKYYHLPCQTNVSLSCFYDEQQLCLCQEHLTNCFDFDHHSRTICSGPNDCEHDGRCVQENSKCPKYFLCQCFGCYYGGRCQLSTDGFSLSLDAILAFHTLPNINLFNQPRAVLISTILSTIIILGGLINAILSLTTFQSQKIRETGCGIYLLTSSVIIVFTMITLTLKFWILILSQIGSLTNQSFLNIQCILIDFSLRLCLTMDQWLTAFVSIERAFVTIRGLNFDKKKMKLVAKYIIGGLLLMTIVTNIHDPMHRNLYEENDDDEEKRYWCIVKYSSTVRTINNVITSIHFIVPFIINLISASMIIIIKSRQRIVLQTGQSYGAILKEQIRQHKNLLLAPFVLVLLAIPRLIISFASGCMKSANDSWLFLLGYFISLVPPVLTFIIFVLPSTTYKQEFRKAMSRYRKLFRRRA